MLKRPSSVFIVTAVAWVSRLAILAAVIFVGAAFYEFLIRSLFTSDSSQILSFFALWLTTAYLVLPRVHRRLTKMYLPNYFIGRTRNSDGLLSDPINVAFNGSGEQLREAMLAAGWVEADPVNLQSMWKVVVSFLTRKPYPSAPVTSLYLFNRKQNFAFQIQTGSLHSRHHVRFWSTPKPWWLPGGEQADWLASGTYDTRILFSAFTWQLDHKIAENIDEERDYIVKSLKEADKVQRVKNIKHFSSAFHDRNGGGDLIKTDGSLPIVTLK